MRFSRRTHTTDVQYRDWTYGLSLLGERTHPSPDVRSLCGRETLFSPNIPYLMFSLLHSCFSRIRTNKRFSTDLENPDLSEFSETLINPGEF
jgi:hypothetical protein